ncbi:MAG: dipeptide epimerase, partial [Candidatus Omnitrophica bacterium]|nr:dipeptide epimerase [Candidatus Omnitrophota bacterium]
LGEAAIATHITGETFTGTRKNLRSCADYCVGRDIADTKKISAQLHEKYSANPAVIAAVETALLDARARHKRVPLWRLFGTVARPLQSDITIVLADLKETRSSIKHYYARGFRAFKVKIGHDLERDIKRLVMLKDMAPRCRIIVDANQGYSAAEMVRFVSELKQHKVRIDLLEQPVPREDWEGLKEIGRVTRVPVCADESARTLNDARRLIKNKIVPAINIKIMKGGLLEAEKIARLCRKNNIKLMIGGMMESSIAMTASAHLAAGLGGFDDIDLDTPFFIHGAVERHPYLSGSGRYDLSKVPAGIGITKDQLYDP